MSWAFSALKKKERATTMDLQILHNSFVSADFLFWELFKFLTFCKGGFVVGTGSFHVL
jgi:hypothetical protein